METRHLEFHTEEYKQIRDEAVGLVEKVDQYFRYAVLVPTAVYSWLVTSAMGTHVVGAATSATPCLKMPAHITWIAWAIPPIFVFFCGLVSLAFGFRLTQMGDYLLRLEDTLGVPALGWEKFNASLKRQLTWARRITWFVILAACIVSSIIGVLQVNAISSYCIAK